VVTGAARVRAGLSLPMGEDLPVALRYRRRRRVYDRGLFWRASDIPGDAGTE